MKKIFSIILFLLFISNLNAQTAEDIVYTAEDLIKGETAYGTFKMTVKTPDYTRTLKMESWWVGNEKALIVIKSPKKEAGNKTLKIGNEMWEYLRNTESVIKIPYSMMLQPWNGSDFTNDDIVREANLVDDYYLKKVKGGKIGNVDCWKIELTPKPSSAVVWGRLYYWVRKTDYLPALVQYYDENGTIIREMIFSSYKKMGGRKIPTVWKMVDRESDGYSTTLKMLDIEFDIYIDNKTFSLSELEKGN